MSSFQLQPFFRRLWLIWSRVCYIMLMLHVCLWVFLFSQSRGWLILDFYIAMCKWMVRLCVIDWWPVQCASVTLICLSHPVSTHMDVRRTRSSSMRTSAGPPQKCLALGEKKEMVITFHRALQHCFQPWIPPQRERNGIRLTLTVTSLTYQDPEPVLQSCVGLCGDNSVHGMKQVLIGCQALWSSLWGSHWLLIGSCIKEPTAAPEAPLESQRSTWNGSKLSVAAEKEFINRDGERECIF